MNRPIVPVVLAGGLGTRLWPLSRDEQTKPFHAFVSEHTLFQETLLRVERLRGGADVRAPIVVCNAAHCFVVSEQLRGIGQQAGAIILEPAGRNTAPATAVAATWAAALSGPEALLLVLPADHVIADVSAFRSAVYLAREPAAQRYLVAFGVTPDRAETGYGYIRRGLWRGRWSLVAEFVEKPDREAAERYVASGAYLWNSGMFMFSAQAYLSELQRLAPELANTARRALAHAHRHAEYLRLGFEYRDCPAESIDRAVMEKTERAAVVPLDAGWSDIGSWPALHEVLERDADGNTVRGNAVLAGCRDTYVLAGTAQRVVAIGLDGCVVVADGDAILVLSKAHAQRLKPVVEALDGGAPAAAPSSGGAGAEAGGDPAAAGRSPDDGPGPETSGPPRRRSRRKSR